jgi:hypothetical protein
MHAGLESKKRLVIDNWCWMGNQEKALSLQLQKVRNRSEASITVQNRYMLAIITMLSRFRFQNKLTEAEERKRRQEKFRKRSPSLFSKAKLLAKDTDAWVALIVCDRAGRIRSFRLSDSLYWPLSTKDLIVSWHVSSSVILYADQGKRRNTLQVSTSSSRSVLSLVAGKWQEMRVIRLW